MSELTHFNAAGEAHMVDVGNKPDTHRVAIATGRIRMLPQTLSRIEQGEHQKGDVLGIARVAGIMASKKTAELIPLCHPLSLSRVDIELTPDREHNAVNCQVRVETSGPTGVEMEALTAVQVTLLTIYDMCKAVDRGMVMEDVTLRHKSGGKSGVWNRGDRTAAHSNP